MCAFKFWVVQKDTSEFKIENANRKLPQAFSDLARIGFHPKRWQA
jgi:hypothetical protein